MKVVVYFDTETTGLEKDDEVIEYAAVMEYDGDVKKVYKGKCSASKPINLNAMSVHHIREEDTLRKRKFGKTNFIKKMKDLNKIGITPLIVAHNADFDVKFLEREGVEVDKYDTLDYAGVFNKHRKMQVMRYAYLSRKDEEFYSKKLGLKGEAHSAAGDVAVLYALTRKMKMKISKEEGEKLKALSFSIHLAKMPFGKHKGEFISDIPDDYLRWVLRTTDFGIERIRVGKEMFKKYSNEELRDLANEAKEIRKKYHN